MAATPTGIYTFISEFTNKHRVPLAGGTYWNIAQEEIGALLQKQKYLLHACEAETSMMLALMPDLIDRDELSQVHGPYVPGLSAIPGVNPRCIPLAPAFEPLAHRCHRRGGSGNS